MLPGINPRSVLKEKCVIEDRRSQADGSAVASFVATENPTMAENRTELLAGNLRRHLKDHLDQAHTPVGASAHGKKRRTG